jgi:hypothetical protein
MNSKYNNTLGQTLDCSKDTASPDVQVASGGFYHRPSALEEMEKQAAHNAEQFQLKSRGIEFLRDNPAFNEFITLIRTGAISI